MNRPLPILKEIRNAILLALITVVLIVVTILFVLPHWELDGSLAHNKLINLATILEIGSAIFIGMMQWKKLHPNRALTFWPAFRVGLLITILIPIFFMYIWEFTGSAKKVESMGASRWHKIEQSNAQGVSQENPSILENLTLMYPYSVGFIQINLLGIGFVITIVLSVMLGSREQLKE